jgi:glycosyltransferase involved in cell wall biosynthesis
MKVGLLHYSAPPVVGGVESVMAKHARLLAADGHEVTVLAGRGAPPGEGIHFHRLPLLDSRHPDVLRVKGLLDQGTVPGEFAQLQDRLAAQLQPILDALEVLIAHNVASLHKNLALTAALHQATSQPHSPALILWHHDLAWTTPRYRNELHDGSPWDLLCQDWPWAAQVVVSEMRQQELADLLGVPRERIQVIPNGVDPVRFFKLEPQTTAWVRQLDLLSAEPLLLLPVRITPRKNIELALDTLARLKEQHPSAALLVTGPLGPHNPANARYFAALSDRRAALRLERSAHFLAELTDEFLPDEVIADCYRLADALLLPSREEGFGIPVIEAGLSGIPVFCADIDPLRRLGESSAHYFSSDAHPSEVAALIAGALDSSPVYRLRCRVRRTFLWDRIYIRQIAPLLHRVRR